MMVRSWYPYIIKHMKWRIIIRNLINKTGQVVTHLLTEEKKRNCSKLPTSMHIFYSWFFPTKGKKNLVFSIKIELVYCDNTLSFTLIIENERQQYIVKKKHLPSIAVDSTISMDGGIGQDLYTNFLLYQTKRKRVCY